MSYIPVSVKVKIFQLKSDSDHLAIALSTTDWSSIYIWPFLVEGQVRVSVTDNGREKFELLREKDPALFRGVSFEELNSLVADVKKAMYRQVKRGYFSETLEERYLTLLEVLGMAGVEPE